MNTALWMLYLGDVATSLNDFLCAVGGISVGVYAVWWIGYAMTRDDCFDVKMPLPRKWLPVLAACAFGAASLIPSKTTFYAIAAATIGEKALQTQTGDKAIRALNAWLDRQIADETTKD